MIDAGCEIVDVGGESTRPGAVATPESEELARIEPVLVELGRSTVSIDTYKAKVAARAVALGAVLVNDVWGLQKDPAMADVVAETGAAVIIMHNRVEKDPQIDIMADIRRFFDQSLALAARAGIRRDRIILDPGIGFAKTSWQNLDAVAGIAKLKIYGLPILIGASRKSFLGGMSAGAEGTLAGTIAVSLAAVAAGASILRVHDVAEHVAALRVSDMIHTAASG
jgi:dihydropteroate synthase